MNKYLEKCAEIYGEDLLEKQALNRLTKEIIKNRKAFGEDTVKNLYQKGALRSQLTIRRGHLKNDRRIQKELGIGHIPEARHGIEDQILTASGGGAFLPHQNNILGARHGGIIHTHETAEGIESHRKGSVKAIRRYMNKMSPELRQKVHNLDVHDPETNAVLARMGKSKRTSAVPIFNEGTPVGQHANVAVLGHESNAIRVNPYSHLEKIKVTSPGLLGFGKRTHKISDFKSLRDQSGEAHLVTKTTGREFGVDKIRNKDLRKLRKLGPNHELELSDGSKHKVLEISKL